MARSIEEQKTQKGINEKRKKSVKQNAKQAAVSITKRLLFCLKWTDDDQATHFVFAVLVPKHRSIAWNILFAFFVKMYIQVSCFFSFNINVIDMQC